MCINQFWQIVSLTTDEKVEAVNRQGEKIVASLQFFEGDLAVGDMVIIEAGFVIDKIIIDA